MTLIKRKKTNLTEFMLYQPKDPHHKIKNNS